MTGCNRSWIPFGLSLAALVIAPGPAPGQEVRTIRIPAGAEGAEVQVEEPEEPEEPLPEALIGIDAYEEVLRSGGYLVGPGDRFLVKMPEAEAPVEVRVLAEGGLFIPRIGRVQVGARRLREVRAVLDSAYRANFIEGRITAELSALRRFPVTVTGLVEEPGVTVANGVLRVDAVLRQVKGLLDDGSRRNIQLIRTHGQTPERRRQLQAWARSGDLEIFARIESRRVDLDYFELTGMSRYNPFVEDGDIIVVPSRQYPVRTMEAWVNPRIVEFVQGDRISDLATLSMGPAPNIDPQGVFLFRFHDDGRRQASRPVDLQAALAGDPAADLPLQPGDWLVARMRQGYLQESTATVTGEVTRPGPYIVGVEGVSLVQVIEWAGGFTQEASLPEARVVRRLQEVDRGDPEFQRILAIPPEAWDKEEKSYFNMKSREKRGQMVVDFVALFQEGDESQNILVRRGDVITIPASRRTVLVSGQAAYPGAVPYVESYTVTDYITRAGGFGWQASGEVEVIKARTGERMGVEDVERIEPGDRIWVKEQPARDYWLLFTQGIQVASQVATVLLLFVTLSN